MALHKNDGDNFTPGTESIQEIANAAGQFNGATIVDNLQQNMSDDLAGAATSILDFTGLSSLMSSAKGSEYTNNLEKVIAEQYKTKSIALHTTVIDKEIEHGLAYSAIVVSGVVSKTEVAYYTIILEGTGNKPLTAKQMMADITASMNAQYNPQKRNNNLVIWTPDMAFDTTLNEKIKEKLYLKYGAGITFSNLDGLMLPTHHNADIPEVASVLSTIAQNAIDVEQKLSTGKKQDLNISHAVNDKTAYLKVESSIIPQGAIYKDKLDRPIAVDAVLDLTHNKIPNGKAGLNSGPIKTVLTKVGIKLDFIPELETIPAGFGTPAQDRIRFRPHIIVTSLELAVPSVGFMLTGLVTSVLMAYPNMWVAVAAANKKSGALNLFANIENNANGIGSVLDFSSKEYSYQDLCNLLKTIAPLPPIISIDVDKFGPQTFYTSILTAGTKNTKGAAMALKQIVDSAYWLTNGNFSDKFDVNKIFRSGVVLPGGTYADTTGEKDIRSLDLISVAYDSKDLDLTKEYVISKLPKDASGQDPFVTTVNTLTKVVPNADVEISSQITRVTFNPDFLETLQSAVLAAGLVVDWEYLVQFQETSNLGVISNWAKNSGYNTTIQPEFARVSNSMNQAGFNFNPGGMARWN